MPLTQFFLHPLATGLPKVETYGLASQIRRAAVAVPANIAEGHGRSYTKEYVRFLFVAYGSLMELETHIRLSLRFGYIDAEHEAALLARTQQVGRMLNSLITSLSGRHPSSPTPDP